MQYEYEIAKLTPKQEFMRVVYKADGYPDFSVSMNPTQFDVEFLEEMIRGRVIQAISFWQRWDQHPESVEMSLTGSDEWVEPEVVSAEETRYEVAPQPEYDIFTQRVQLQDEVNSESLVYEWDVVELTAEEKSAFLQEWRKYASVTMRQARLALAQQGFLETVEDAIALIPEPDKSAISIEWEYSATVQRSSSWVGTLAPALGLSDEQMDDLFKLASTL
jgi:hypothetical protein